MNNNRMDELNSSMNGLDNDLNEGVDLGGGDEPEILFGHIDGSGEGHTQPRSISSLRSSSHSRIPLPRRIGLNSFPHYPKAESIDETTLTVSPYEKGVCGGAKGQSNQNSPSYEYTVDTIPLRTLLNYLKKDELLENILTPEIRNQIELIAVKERKRLTKGLIRDWITSQDEDWQRTFGTRIRQSPFGIVAFDQYKAAVERLRDPSNKEKSSQAKKATAHARKGFMGCIATKVKPADFKHCSQHFDQPDYQFDIVPAAVRQNALFKAGLTDKQPDPRHISYLPLGLRQYIAKNPLLFEDYLEERQSEVKFLQAVRRNALNALYSGRPEFTMRLPQNSSSSFNQAPSSSSSTSTIVDGLDVIGMDNDEANSHSRKRGRS